MKTYAALALLLVCVAAQAPSAPRFDVVSVKEDTPYSAGLRNGTWPKQPGFISPDTWTCARMSVSRILNIAFGLQDNQMIGVPSWAEDSTVDIEAKLSPGADHSQLPQMLQAMLADRFKLVSHRAMQVMNVRDLKVAKGGAKLKPATQHCTDDPNVPLGAECCATPLYVVCASGTASRYRGLDCSHVPVPHCGDVARGGNPLERGGLLFSGVGATMADIVRVLDATTSGPPFVDHTGLRGRFDFSITVDLPPINPAGASAPPAMEDMQYRLRTGTERAWLNQAGLVVNFVKTYKEPYPVLVIDHIAHPTAN